MYIFGNFFYAIAVILNMVLSLYMYIVIARAVLSWVNPDPYNPIVRAIHNITEPLLGRVRRTIPMAAGGVDFTPIVVILVIYLIQKHLLVHLEGFARSLM